jgi:hypothetical protein
MEKGIKALGVKTAPVQAKKMKANYKREDTGFGVPSEGHIDNDYFSSGEYSLSMSESGDLYSLVKDYMAKNQVADGDFDAVESVAKELFDMYNHDPAIKPEAIMEAYRRDAEGLFSMELDVDAGLNPPTTTEQHLEEGDGKQKPEAPTVKPATGKIGAPDAKGEGIPMSNREVEINAGLEPQMKTADPVNHESHAGRGEKGLNRETARAGKFPFKQTPVPLGDKNKHNMKMSGPAQDEHIPATEKIVEVNKDSTPRDIRGRGIPTAKMTVGVNASLERLEVLAQSDPQRALARAYQLGFSNGVRAGKFPFKDVQPGPSTHKWKNEGGGGSGARGQHIPVTKREIRTNASAQFTREDNRIVFADDIYDPLREI